MTQTQSQSIKITSRLAAQALQRQNHFLLHFLEPQSPSDVASVLKIAANLAHHHAKNLTELGLLFEAQRANGKVYYQLASREFRVPWEVLDIQDQTGTLRNLEQLSTEFSKAYECSWRKAGESEEQVFTFDPNQPQKSPIQPSSGQTEAFPSHFEMVSLSLSAKKYCELAKKINQLLQEVVTEQDGEGQSCTFAFLGYQGTVNGEEPQKDLVSRSVSTFLELE